jgi:SEC-C motif-containing protein
MANALPQAADTACPCSSGEPFGRCCGPFLAGEAAPPTALALMRARYCAYATANIDFLKDTLLPGTDEAFDRQGATDWAQNSEWTGLTIRTAEAGGVDDKEGVVEFVAHFRQNGQDLIHHETGRFEKQDGRWYYTDGVAGQRPRQSEKIGRNDPCPCGSGKKYKKCCGSRG